MARAHAKWPPHTPSAITVRSAQKTSQRNLHPAHVYAVASLDYVTVDTATVLSFLSASLSSCAFSPAATAHQVPSTCLRHTHSGEVVDVTYELENLLEPSRRDEEKVLEGSGALYGWNVGDNNGTRGGIVAASRRLGVDAIDDYRRAHGPRYVTAVSCTEERGKRCDGSEFTGLAQ